MGSIIQLHYSDFRDAGRFDSTGSHVANGGGYIERIMKDDERRNERVGCSTKLNRLFTKLMETSKEFSETVYANSNLRRKKSDRLLLITEFCKYSRNIDSALGPPDRTAKFIGDRGTPEAYSGGGEDGDYEDT